jgi:carbonic anhydrase
MEMHLVHQSNSGKLAAIGVFIEEGEHNHAFDAVWQNLPTVKGERVHVEGVQVDIDDLLPDNPAVTATTAR